MLWGLLVWAVFGLIVGGIARLLVPGRDPMGCLGTMLLGVAGSLLGGFLASLFIHGDRWHPASWIGAIIGGVILLLLGRMISPRHRSTI